MPIELSPTLDVSVGATRLFAVDLTDDLDAFPSETLLTGTPTITATPSGLTLANKAVNTVALKINDSIVAVGKAVQFTATGFADDATYTVTISVGTNSTPAETIVYDLKVKGT